MSEIKTCCNCNGKGGSMLNIRYGSRSHEKLIDCNYCKGSGRVIFRTFNLSVPLNSTEEFFKKTEEILKILQRKN